MIVICTKCQAKFRVADGKIGSRGAKVRCSRCQTIFLVHPDLGSVAVADGAAQQRTGAMALEAPTGAVRAPKREIPTLAAPAPVAAAVAPPADPFGGADPFASPPPAADPFAPPPGPDPFASAGPAADPFASADPFAAVPDPFAAPADPDHLAAPSAPAASDFGDSFAAAVAPRSTLPVTDLSDLLGAAAAPPAAAAPFRPSPRAAPAPTAVPPPLPVPAPAASDPFAAADAGGLALEPPSAPVAVSAPASFRADPFAAPDPFALGASPAPAPAGADGDLALEDRETPPPVQVAPPEPSPEPALETGEHSAPGAPADPFAGFGAAASAGAGEPYDPGAFDFGADLGEAAPALASEPVPPPPVAQRAPVAASDPAAARPSPPPALGAVPQPAERIPGARTSRLRAVAVNAVALVALLAVALAIWVVWRTDGPLDASALRPSNVLAALGRGGAATGPWSAQEIRSGIYDRERGAPLLFVRGRIVSRAVAAVPGVKVAVQVVRAGQVVARGEVLAGAVATPEELWGAGDDAALAAVAAAARARAPAEVRPGDSVPFLVAIGDAPLDLEGASLRVDVAPAGGGAP